MKRRNIVLSISGAAVLLATAVLSALCIKDWSGLTRGAFCAVLWSETAFFGGSVFVEYAAAKTEQIITRAALYSTLSCYAVINIAVSLLYIARFQQAVTSYVVIETVLLAIAAVVIVVSLAASRSVHQANEKSMEQLAAVESLIERLDKLSAAPAYQAYSAALKKLSEDLRFTDMTVSAPEDAGIGQAISAIETEGGSGDASEAVKANLIQISALISQRKAAAGAAKKGRI